MACTFSVSAAESACFYRRPVNVKQAYEPGKALIGSDARNKCASIARFAPNQCTQSNSC
jgi:hypothetical protein